MLALFVHYVNSLKEKVTLTQKKTCLCSLLRYLENTDKIEIKLVDISQVQGSYRPT